MVIAVDFDGTLVKHKFPKIGKKVPFSTEAVKQLKADGHRIVLWTYRSGKTLEAAMDYCKKEGLEFDAYNKNSESETYKNRLMSRKIVADIYIDDRNIGGLGDWRDIYFKISGRKLPDVKER